MDTNVYFYTPQGQAATSSAQQDRDKYDCYVWATQQSGFDPSLPEVPPHLHVRLVGGPPPGTDVAAGALTGAVLGAAVSDPWHAGQGTLIGALAGAAIGGIADAEQSSRNHQVEAQTNAQLTGARSAATEHEALEFRRAMTACLEGHGYVVR